MELYARKSRHWSPVLRSMKEDKRNSQEWIHTQALKDTHSESIITPAGKGPARRHHAAVRAQVLGLDGRWAPPAVKKTQGYACKVKRDTLDNEFRNLRRQV